MQKHNFIQIRVDQKKLKSIGGDRAFEACEYLQIEAAGRDLEREQDLFAGLSRDAVESVDEMMRSIPELLPKSTRAERRKLRQVLGWFATRLIERGQVFDRDSRTLEHSSKRKGSRSDTLARYEMIRRHLGSMTGISEADRIQELAVAYRNRRSRQSKEFSARFDDGFPSSTTIWRAAKAVK